MESFNSRSSFAALTKIFAGTGITPPNDLTPHVLASFVGFVLRGIGQVMLQNNSYTGLLFLIGIFYHSVTLGCAALLGGVASTLTAVLLGAERSHISAGLFGFNGVLVGIALLYFLEPNSLTWGYVIIAAACSTIIMSALLNLLSTWNFPALTAPFVITTLLFILASARFGRLASTDILPTAGLPTAATVEGVVTFSTLMEGLFNGVAQVFFQGSLITGIIFAIGLLVSSRLAFAAALFGSFIGMLVAWGMGADEVAIRAGAFGFNCVLTAIVFAELAMKNTASFIYATLAVVATAVVFAAMSAALEPLGMPALTSPFVLVVWFFLLAGPQFKQLKPPESS